MAVAAATVLPLAASLPSGQQYLTPSPAGYMARSVQMEDFGNFAGAADQAERLLRAGKPLTEAEVEQCIFILAKARYELGDRHCLALLDDYTATWPASSRALEARLLAADFHFFSHDFAAAYTAYCDIDISALDSGQRPRYLYRKALSALKCGETEISSRLFTELEKDAAYRPAATFYLAYIDYARGDYAKAYPAFEKAARLLGQQGSGSASGASRSSARAIREYQPTGLEVGYYLTQMDYSRGEYDKVIEDGRMLLSRQPVGELMPEMNRVVGESYFKTGDHATAVGFLEEYVNTCGHEPEPSALYALGVADYEKGDYTKAEERFSRLTQLNDPIGQSAWLFLGQCMVRRGDEKGAALAFERAYRMDCDREVTETALYDYVASRTQGERIPFGSSVGMLEDFLKRFPSSSYAPAVEEYLAVAYYNEKDYRRALEGIDRISERTPQVTAIRRKILYELGMEAVANDHAAEAERYLAEALRIKGDRDLTLQITLWLADARYSLGKYSEAADGFSRFVKESGNSADRTLALYDLAYSIYQQKDYAKAATAFSNALAAKPSLPAALQIDATLRRADCRYYSGDLRNADADYASVMSSGGNGADYAAWRRAVVTGLRGDVDGKLRRLKEMEKQYPSSPWLPKAILEAGETYSSLGRAADAQREFDKLEKSYPSSPEARRGMLRREADMMKAGDLDNAALICRRVIEQWPSSSEAAVANEDLRQIYASQGKLDEYLRFIESTPGAPSISASEVESLAYDAAADAYGADAKATSLLRKYLRDYPDGRYLAPASLSLAEAEVDAGNSDEAERLLKNIIDRRPDAQQTPEALLMLAEIYESKGRDSWPQALETYLKLERRGGTDYMADAAAGVMRTSQSAAQRLEYAGKLTNAPGVSAEDLALADLTRAEDLRDKGQTAEAEKIMRTIAANTDMKAGARAAVELADMLNTSGNTAEAEKLMTEFTDKGTPHAYWLARGYILLADICAERGKKYLAYEYMRSLKENYPGRELDIHDMINQRLNEWKQ